MHRAKEVNIKYNKINTYQLVLLLILIISITSAMFDTINRTTITDPIGMITVSQLLNILLEQSSVEGFDVTILETFFSPSTY